jgi:hypothetical protein
LKFFTAPDDADIYRAQYPTNNFSFSPPTTNNITNEFVGTQLIGAIKYNHQPLPLFPSIPDNYKGKLIFLFRKN